MKILLTPLLAAMLASPLAQVEVEGQRVKARIPTDLTPCRHNRLLPDPSSRRVVLWEAQRDFRGPIRLTFPGGFTVAEIPSDGVEEEAFARLTSVGANARVEPLRWSASGDRLLFRVRENAALLYDPASGALTAAPPLDPLWQLTRIEATSHGDTDFYRSPALLGRLGRIHDEGNPVRTIATLGADSATFLVFRSGNKFRFTAYEGDRRWETGIPIAFASAALLPPGTRRPLFLGDQAGYSSFLPYALPLIDRVSGRVVGRFGWERIELRDGRAVDLLPHFNQLMTISDASANGDTIFALVDLERERRVVRISDGEVRSWRLCEKRWRDGKYIIPLENALRADTPVMRSQIRFGRRGDGADAGPFGFLYRPVRADGRLIVYFHGGPTATLAEQTVPRQVQQFARHGISVLAVEQSGMLGGGLALSKRLPRRGLRALREDVAAVTRWVGRSGYRKSYLLASSFGGASAVIAAVEHESRYDHIFLVVPFLALRDPEQSVRRDKLFAKNVLASSQREFEETVYGGARGRARLGADLQSYVRRLRPSPRLSFYFGARDPVSAAADLPPSFAGHPSVMIEAGSHETGGGAKALRDIFSKLGIEADDRDLGLVERAPEEAKP